MNQLDYETFISEIKKSLQKKMGEDVRIDIHDTVKNNEVTYKGLSVLKKGSNISPNLRLDDFYSMYLEEENIDKVSEKMMRIFEKNFDYSVDMDDFTNYEKAKKNIVFKLVSYEENKERLKNIPHIRFLDLAVIYYYYMEKSGMPGGAASIQIEKEHVAHWGINKIILHKTAMENTVRLFPAKLQTMQEILTEMMTDRGMDSSEFQHEMTDMQNHLPMYVLTNHKKYFGAAALYYPDELKRIGEKLETDLLIIPSSVHEVIILPVTGEENFEDMNDLIRDINENQVADEEVLSNHIYYYDRKKEKLVNPAISL